MRSRYITFFAILVIFAAIPVITLFAQRQTSTQGHAYIPGPRQCRILGNTAQPSAQPGGRTYTISATITCPGYSNEFAMACQAQNGSHVANDSGRFIMHAFQAPYPYYYRVTYTPSPGDFQQVGNPLHYHCSFFPLDPGTGEPGLSVWDQDLGTMTCTSNCATSQGGPPPPQNHTITYSSCGGFGAGGSVCMYSSSGQSCGQATGGRFTNTAYTTTRGNANACGRDASWGNVPYGKPILCCAPQRLGSCAGLPSSQSACEKGSTQTSACPVGYHMQYKNTPQSNHNGSCGYGTTSDVYYCCIK